MSRGELALGRRLSRFRRLGPICARGAAAIEFALFAPVLILMILGLFEYSRWAGVEIELEQSLRSGAQIAMSEQTYLAGFCAAIESAVVAASNLTPPPTEISCTSPPDCVCPDGTINAGGCPGAASYSACPGDIEPDVFVTIEYGTTYDPLFFKLPGVITDPKQELTIRVR